MRALEWLCTAKMDKPIFQTTYTLTLNDYGGIENDFTVTRVAEDEFLIVTGASATKYVLSLLKSITTTQRATEHTDAFKDLIIRLDVASLLQYFYNKFFSIYIILSITLLKLIINYLSETKQRTML